MAYYRDVMVNKMRSYLGAVQGDSLHKSIIDKYNEKLPHPRGYAMTYDDDWCAATVSAAAFDIGYTNIIPFECSVGQMITIAQSMGIWVENDAHTPQPGDLIVYDWEDTGAGDDTTGHDHIGCVEVITGVIMTVIEGNNNHTCRRRNVTINGRYIRGFITPNYSGDVDPDEPIEPVEPDYPFDPTAPRTVRTYEEMRYQIGKTLENLDIIEGESLFDISGWDENAYGKYGIYKNDHSALHLVIIRNKLNGQRAPLFIWSDNIDGIIVTLEGISIASETAYMRVNVRFGTATRAVFEPIGTPLSEHLYNTGGTLTSELMYYVREPFNGVFILSEPYTPYDGKYKYAISRSLGSSPLSTQYYDMTSTGWRYQLSGIRENTGFYNGMEKAEVMNSDNYEITDTIIYSFYTPGPGPDPPDPPQPGGDMTLQLWKNFNKRKNSTKRPTTTGETLDVRFVEDTSIIEPHFILNRQDFTYNYCYFQGRYYYINNVVSLNNNLIRLECKIDYLATWKDIIKGSSAYIDRCAWSTNHILLDNTNSPTDEVVSSVMTSSTAVVSEDAGRYLFYTTGIHGLNLYNMSEADAGKIFEELWAQTTITPDQAAAIRSAILFCRRCPIEMEGTSGQMDVGTHYTTTLTDCKKVDEPNIPIEIGPFTIPLTFPSDTWENGECYLDHSPYTTGLIYLPYVGIVPLDIDYFATKRTVKIMVHLDKMSGDIVYSISDVNNNIISTYGGNCVADVPISNYYYDKYGANNAIMTMIGGTVGMVGGIQSMNIKTAAGGIAAVAGGANALLKACETHTQVGGAISSNMGFYLQNDGKIRIIIITKKPVNTDLDANKTLHGLPYQKTGSLNNSGYVKTVGAQISMSGTEQEREAVNSLLDSGIYIE